MSATTSATNPVLKRILANTAWLLGGKGFGAICSLFYLAILSRSLGVKNFGHFALIFGTGQALVALASVQTWQAVVRYGVGYVHRGEWEQFGRLSILCGLIDALGALVGCAVAYVVFFGFAEPLQLNPAFITIGFAFCCTLVWARVSAPSGMLRALNRFDKAAYVEAFVPAARLVAAVAIWLTGPTVVRFLLAWAIIDLTCAVLYWWIALRQIPSGANLDAARSWRRTLSENPGIVRFLAIISVGSTVDAAYKQGPLLAVGYFLGTSMAGLYRLADQLAQGFGKLASLLARAVYAEMTRVQAAAAAAEFRKLAVQTSLIASIAGAVLVCIALIAGKQLLAIIGGDAFEAGGVVLVPLAIAASFDLASVAFEPVLHSTGRAQLGLIARITAITALGIGIAVLNVYGAVGIASAVAIAGGVGYLAMGAMAFSTLRRIAVAEAAAPASAGADEGSTAK